MPPLRRMPPLRWIPPPPPDWAIAELCREVERSIVIAGGVTTANFPQVAKNFRRSLSASSSGRLVISVPIESKITRLHSNCSVHPQLVGTCREHRAANFRLYPQ